MDGCEARVKAVGLCGKHYKRRSTWGDENFTAYSTSAEINASIVSGAVCSSDDCLLWPHGKSTDGYGYVWLDGRVQPVHRVICEIVHGPAPSANHEAAHRCGKGRLGCFNQKHLRWATPAENAADRILHGTTGKGMPKPSSRGTNNKNSKLTEVMVRQIRELSMQLPQKEIGKRFGIHHSTVGRIIRGDTWGWLA
ncbi:MAG: HNH endonuclease [Devosia sp.]|nr:HNH endonuclease [Devosia sp.]